jgi:hypothetical protein
LDWILGRLAGWVWSGFSWLRIRTSVGCCEHSDEPSGFGATELVSYLFQSSMFQWIQMVRQNIRDFTCIPSPHIYSHKPLYRLDKIWYRRGCTQNIVMQI